MLTDRELERYGESFLQSFEAIRRALGLYPPNHPNVIDLLGRFLRNLAELRERVGDATFNVINREFFVNGVPLKRISLTYERNLAEWDSRGMGLVRFGPEATNESILRFFEIVSRSGSEGVAAELEKAGVHGIRASRVSASITTAEQLRVESTPLAGVAPSDAAEARSRFRDSVGELAGMVEQACEGAGRPARAIRALAQGLENRLLERRPVRELLEGLQKHDPDGYEHSLGGAMVAVLLGAALGLERPRLSLLGEAAALRDIGLLQVEPALLRERAGDDVGRTAYQRHPALGARVLLARPELDPTAAIVALEHHARHDGRGYPRIRARRGLHPLSRIVAVASDYDDLTGGYRRQPRMLPADAARTVFAGRGSAYDPAVVRTLLRLIGLFPEGTLATLRDGGAGVVAHPGRRSWLAPEVALLRDAAGPTAAPAIVATDALAPPGESSVLQVAAATAEDGRRVEPLQFAS